MLLEEKKHFKLTVEYIDEMFLGLEKHNKLKPDNFE